MQQLTVLYEHLHPLEYDGSIIRVPASTNPLYPCIVDLFIHFVFLMLDPVAMRSCEAMVGISEIGEQATRTLKLWNFFLILQHGQDLYDLYF